MGPGTEVSHSAAGMGAPAGQWRWPVLGGPESACGPESLLELGRSGPENNGCICISFNKLLQCLMFIVITVKLKQANKLQPEAVEFIRNIVLFLTN